MPTQFKLPAGTAFPVIERAEHRRLYVAEIASTFELAVGFKIQEWRTGVIGTGIGTDVSTGLLYLTGGSFGKIKLFLPNSSEPNLGVCAHALDATMDTVDIQTMEGSTTPTLYSIGILPNRENLDVFVKEGTRDGLQPLYVDLRELDLHRSAQNYTSGFSFCGVTHEIIIPDNPIETVPA